MHCCLSVSGPCRSGPRVPTLPCTAVSPTRIHSWGPRRWGGRRGGSSHVMSVTPRGSCTNETLGGGIVEESAGAPGLPPPPRRPGPSHPPRTHPTVRSSPKLCWETGRMASSKKAFRIENVLNSRRIIPTVTLPVRVTFETSNSKMVIKIKDSSNSFMTPTAHSRKWEPTVGRPRASSRADGARPRGQTVRVLAGRSPSSASHPGRPGLTAALFHLCASYTLAVHPSIHAASLFMPQAILGRKGTCRA